MIDRFAKIGYATKRRSTKMGALVNTTEGTLTEAERNTILDLIDATNVKASAIETFVTAQGSNLATKLGNWIGSWNTNWNKAQAFSPTVMQISLDLSSSNALLWSWDPTKDSAVTQWKGAIDNLYQIMQAATSPLQPPPIPPPPGGGPPPPPQPQPPASTTSDVALYAVAGVGGLALIGSILYVLTR